MQDGQVQHLARQRTVDSDPGPNRYRQVEPPLRARLVVPAAPTNFVARPRLARHLDRATAGPVTVVTAAPGWGKTALLSSWIRDTRAPTTWLTVEPDDDGNRCRAHVHEALSTVWPNGNDDQPPVPAPGLLPRRATSAGWRTRSPAATSRSSPSWTPRTSLTTPACRKTSTSCSGTW